ncbi:PQQ-dependent sugar dehydrogenase [Thermosynechococcus sp. B0]|nr:PQQ-dependent sugar dehydrogenase [Thermosynechococcus sp. B0]WJI24114.1 PQQ-dependent sugar dehydrogenase [Thermosynechococcus sp. B0]
MPSYRFVKLLPLMGAIGVFLGCSPIAQSDTPLPLSTAEPLLESQPPPTLAVRIETVVEGLEHPWAVTWLPDGSALITERPGRLRRFHQGRLGSPIRGVPPVFAQGQGGLLDVALHPRFAENNWVYLTYAHGTASANRTRLARGRLVGDRLEEVTVLFEVSQAKTGGQHFGSRLAWLPDGTLLMAIGDGGNPPIELEGKLIREQAQNRRSHLGKIIRLRDDGTVPEDNPFVGDATATPELWSYGHRNIQGLVVDPVTEAVWSTEHGSLGGDELNRIERGANYGWPVVTYSREYWGAEITPERRRPGMVDPLVVWTPAIAPSGLAVYRGDRAPQWQGALFAGGLVSQDVRKIRVNTNTAVESQGRIPIGQRVRDVRQGPDGYLYVLTDDPQNGRLLRLIP